MISETYGVIHVIDGGEKATQIICIIKTYMYQDLVI